MAVCESVINVSLIIGLTEKCLYNFLKLTCPMIECKSSATLTEEHRLFILALFPGADTELTLGGVNFRRTKGGENF